MLADLIREGFGDAQDYNCAERIIYGANEAYGLNLDKETLKLFACYGGGLGIGQMCGTMCSATAIISHFFVKDHANEDWWTVKDLLVEFHTRYVEKMKCYEATCSRLKELYRNPTDRCFKVIYGAAELLDEFLVEKGADIPALRK